MSQGVAAMAGVLHQRVCECMTVQHVGTQALCFTYRTNISSALMVHFD